jgi:hypothetical protein
MPSVVVRIYSRVRTLGCAHVSAGQVGGEGTANPPAHSPVFVMGLAIKFRHFWRIFQPATTTGCFTSQRFHFQLRQKVNRQDCPPCAPLRARIASG